LRLTAPVSSSFFPSPLLFPLFPPHFSLSLTQLRNVLAFPPSPPPSGFFWDEA
jgi:hypothetical protein